MKFIVCLVLLVCGAVYAQTAPIKESPKIPQVDTAEVLRRGDMVVIAGEGPRGIAEDSIRAATAPPPDESHMWFVTVIKTNNCSYCTKLHSDFQQAPELLAYVAAVAPYKPWGHYNEYNVSDETQKWRIQHYRITGYPTIVIQPPRNGMWGSPRTVVFQTTGYDGNPKKLAAAITAGVRKYAVTMSKQGYPKIQDTVTSTTTPLWGKNTQLLSEGPVNSFPVFQGGSQQFTPEPTSFQKVTQIETNPPFVTPPRIDPFNPQPTPNQPIVTPQWPPTDQPQPQLPGLGTVLSLIFQLIGGMLSGSTITNLLLVLLLGIKFLEVLAPQTKTKVDDQVLVIVKQLETVLKTTLTPRNPDAPNTTPPTV
jgi:hypothetical protein